MSKQFWGVVLAIVLVFVGIVALTGGSGSDKQSGGNSAALSKHVEGKGQAGVTLVEYGDFQCPYCAQYYPVLKQVKAEFNDQITFQFRHYPLTSIHQNAFAGARAAEAAGLQGKFWEMHDLLYEQQTQWSSSSNPTTFFKQYAQQLGLNVDQFQKDYASSRVNDTINADMAEGNKLKIEGTPTFFLDGKKIDVGQSVSDFEKQIKAAIDKKAAPANTGTTQQSQGTADTTD